MTTPAEGLDTPETEGTAVEVQRPVKQTLAGALRREGNWKCLLLTLMIVGCLTAVTWCNFAQRERKFIDLSMFPIESKVMEPSCDVGYAYIPLAFVVLLYLVYLVECYHSTARIQLSRKVDLPAVQARIRAMTQATPRVWWKAICYHYVRRKRRVTRYRHGDAYTTTQVYYERVNTHSASTTFAQDCCGQKDASLTLIIDEDPVPITKVRFSKGFAFANIEAASEFEDQRSRFFADHERYDDFMEMREGLDLIGITAFKEYMVAYRNIDNFCWYSSQLFFWIVSALLLSWPLRILLECNTSYVHYTLTKIFGTNYDNQSAVRQRPRPNLQEVVALSAASTVDSLQLFASIRENCAVAPSYSEAMRLDAHAQSTTELNDNQQVETRLVTFDESVLRRKKAVSQINIADNKSTVKKADRRSWAGWTAAPTINPLQGLYLPTDLPANCGKDPFGGRDRTSPMEEPPPSYDEAMRLPSLFKAIADKVMNRRSYAEEVDVEAEEIRLIDENPGNSSPVNV